MLRPVIWDVDSAVEDDRELYGATRFEGESRAISVLSADDAEQQKNEQRRFFELAGQRSETAGKRGQGEI